MHGRLEALRDVFPHWVEVERENVNTACDLLCADLPQEGFDRWMYYGSYFGISLFLFREPRDAMMFKLKIGSKARLP